MAADPVQEQAIELGGERAQAANARKVLLVARQWRHAAQPAVRGTVIDLFQPGPKPGIEVVQAVDLGGVQFAEDLVAASAMPAFELAFAFGTLGPAIDELNAPAPAATWQGLGQVSCTVHAAQFAA